MFFRPIYLPLNEAASGLVLALAKELGISVSGKAGKKHTVLLSSFIFCAQHLGSDHLLQWPYRERKQIPANLFALSSSWFANHSQCPTFPN
jgi:hypothetical protein